MARVTIEHNEDYLKIIGLPNITDARKFAQEYAKSVGVIIVDELGGSADRYFSFVTKPAQEVTTGILRGPTPADSYTDLY